MNIWKNDDKGDDKIIAFFNDMIYRVNPKQKDIEQVLFDFTVNKPPTSNYTAIPLRQIREINMEDNKDYIVVLFNRDSYEHLRIKDSFRRKEIFEYFKTNISNTHYTVTTYNKLETGKKPLIAMVVIVAICLWTLYIASTIEKGTNYNVQESGMLAKIVILIAASGIKNILLIFGSLSAIAFASFLYKTRSPKKVKKIIVH